jgi:hypothetical protein
MGPTTTVCFGGTVLEATMDERHEGRAVGESY